MQLDPAAYAHHLAAFDMSEEAKLGCIQTVWAFLEGELDRQCGGSSEQILLGIRARQVPDRGSDRLNSVPALTKTYNDAARGAPAGKRYP